MKSFAWRVPGLRRVYHSVRDAYVAYKLRHSTTEEVFTDIYAHNRWGGTASASGTGSHLDQTSVLREALPTLFRELGVVSVLDIPCGDFHWMRTVNLNGMNYIGGDIVRALVRRNKEHYSRPRTEFRQINLLEDPLPQVGIILCRDCLVHLSFSDIIRALRNMCASGSEYLLTTTFCGPRKNLDILTGDWRPLNLECPPFGFPPPLRLINEGCTEKDGAYQDKALGLWCLIEPPISLDRRLDYLWGSEERGP